MSRKRLTPAERLAATNRDELLDDIVKRTSDWDRFLVEQAVFCFGLANDEFSANNMREVLPELGHGFLGAAFNSLRTSGVIEHTGRYVPSTSPATARLTFSSTRFPTMPIRRRATRCGRGCRSVTCAGDIDVTPENSSR